MCRSILQTSCLCKYVCISVKEFSSLNPLAFFVICLLKLKLSRTAAFSPSPRPHFMFSRRVETDFFMVKDAVLTEIK